MTAKLRIGNRNYKTVKGYLAALKKETLLEVDGHKIRLWRSDSEGDEVSVYVDRLFFGHFRTDRDGQLSADRIRKIIKAGRKPV